MVSDGEILNSLKMAEKEFHEEPMSQFYKNPFAGYPSRLRVRKILKEVGNFAGKKVLDVGCEEGYVAFKILKKNPLELYGVDIVEEALNSFKEKLKNSPYQDKVFLKKAFLQKLPFDKDFFDILICTEVIEHAPKVEKGFKEMARVLKGGGKLVITFPNEKLRKKVYPLVKRLGVNTDIEKDVTLFDYDPKFIQKELKKYFKIIKYYRFPFYFPMTNMLICEKLVEEKT